MPELTFHWNTQLSLENFHLKLLPYQKQTISEPLEPKHTKQLALFQNLDSGDYLLDFHYEFQGQPFNACFFLMDTLDISLIRVEIIPEGTRLEEMGFFNEQGQFVDMLLYEGEKPFLTFPVKETDFHYYFAHGLALEFTQKVLSVQRKELQFLCRDLGQVFPVLEKLWPYQLKKLITPALLAKTTPEWKACLLHVLQNHLLLADDERLLTLLSDAIEQTQQEERVSFLADLMQWDPVKGIWENYPVFLKEITGCGACKS